MKKCIYTVNFGDYDSPKPIQKQKGIDCIYFTDNPDLQVQGWDVRYIKDGDVKKQRDIKIRPHEYLKEYDVTIYIDASYKIVGDLNTLLSRLYKGGMLTKTHPARKCFIEEGYKIIELNRDKPETIRTQLAKYISEGMPINFGMFETGIIVRDRSVSEMCEMWAKEVQDHSHRDQVSITYALWRTGCKISGIPSLRFNQWFQLEKHKPAFEPKIYYSTPYATDFNIGRAYNEFISLLPDDAWICLRDGDTCFTTPDSNWGKQISDIVKKHGKDFALIGCYTNRLASTDQLYGKKFSEEWDWMRHKEIGQELYSNHYDEVVKVNHGIAGMFMLFPKKTWLKCRFKEDLPYRVFDTDFCNKVKANGGKIGMAKGLYLFHDYRAGKENPKTNTSHLK